MMDGWPYPSHQELRKDLLLGRVLSYFSEHEAEEARPDRWRVHLGKDTDRRLKSLRDHLDGKLDALEKKLAGRPGANRRCEQTV